MGWVFLVVYYTSCCCTFLCSFIMSQSSTTTATTTTLPVMVVSLSLSYLSSVTMAPSFMKLPVTLGQHDVVLPPMLTPRCSGGVIGLATVSQQQPSSLMPLHAYANYAMGSPHVGFFSELRLPLFLYYLFGVCFLLSGSMLDAIFTYGSSTIGI